MSIKDEILTKYKSVSEFAAQIGFTRQKMFKIIHGIYVPKVSEAVKMSGALGISVDELAKFF